MHIGVVTLVAAAAPALFLLAFFYLKDRYEREPLLHLLTAFALGVYAMIAARGMATTAESWVDPDWLVLGGEPGRLYDAFVLSGFVEESAKWVVLMAAVYHWDEFDEPLDGVVYGAAVALGFATLENVLFVARLGLGVAWQRALFAVPAHALFGATMGYYAGRAKFARAHAGAPAAAPSTSQPASASASGVASAIWRARVLGLAAPVAFHGLYDYALHHGLGPRIWALISLLSVALWVFVLRRVQRAQRLSPFRNGPPG